MYLVGNTQVIEYIFFFANLKHDQLNLKAQNFSILVHSTGTNLKKKKESVLLETVQVFPMRY